VNSVPPERVPLRIAFCVWPDPAQETLSIGQDLAEGVNPLRRFMDMNGCGRKRGFLVIGMAAGTLLVAGHSFSMPPIPHRVQGVMESVDPNGQTLTLRLINDGETLVFAWNNSTRFSHGSRRICPGAVHPGEPVSASYRREVGRTVLRAVRLRTKESVPCSADSGCTSTTSALK